MQVAAEHPEAECECAGANVKERLLFDGIALDGVDVTVRREQLSSAVESHFAHALEAGSDGAAMPACQAAEATCVEGFEKFGLAAKLGKSFG